MNTQNPKFVYVTIIKTTPEKLWKALTDPEFTSKYMVGTCIESDWKPGSRMHWSRDGKISLEGTVLKSEPPRLLSYSFHPLHYEDALQEHPSRVTFEIQILEGGSGRERPAVRLTITHDDFDNDSKILPRISGGWPLFLSSLKTLLETGQPLELTKCG